MYGAFFFFQTEALLSRKNAWLPPIFCLFPKAIGSSFRLSKVGSIRISADDTPLDNVHSYMYLGVVINNRFSWSDHIEPVRSKISKNLGLLRRIKSCLSLSARITFF